MWYIIISAIFIYFAITMATAKRTEKIKRAFAGAYDGKDTIVNIPRDRNNTIYTEGENRINLSKYEKYLISGHSLEKVGLPDGVFVYTTPLDSKDLYSLCNHFVIIKYDNERLYKEHPEITNPVDGYKARKVVTIIETNLTEENFNKKMEAILSSDKEIQDVNQCIQCLWRKYKFASEYYNSEDKLIVSITYKEGKCKDYSFHSLQFVQGVVKYKSVS